MKIFGIEFTTKKELKDVVSALRYDLDACEAELEERTEELINLRSAFPLDIDQVVYDVALKDDVGRYTKTKPSIEHSTITEVTVNEKNYFGLISRLKRNDVFITKEAAEVFLKSICS